MDRGQLILKHLRLADTVAYKMWRRNKSLELEDWKQSARQHLCEAVDKYDPERGKFSTFAWRVIWTGLISEARSMQIHNVKADLVDDIDEIEDDSLCHYSIDELLSTLTPLQEHIVRLRVLDGLKLREIAKQLNMTPQGVDYHYKRALKTLKNLI